MYPLSPIFPIMSIPSGRTMKFFLSLWYVFAFGYSFLIAALNLGPGTGSCFFWNYTCSMTRRLCRGQRVFSWHVPSSELLPQPYRMGKMKAQCSGLVVSGIELLPYEWGLDDTKQPWLSCLCLLNCAASATWNRENEKYQ